MIVPEGFARHPEGGWYRETWRSPLTVTTPRGPRASATAISFLLGPGDRSDWHRVRGSGELWIWAGGGALRLTLGGTGRRPREGRTVVLGPESQHLVEPDEWQRAEPVDEAVMSVCVVSPGFDFADFELGERPPEPERTEPPTSWTSPLPPVRAPEVDRPLAVLLVCEGNICRSPMAQAALLRDLEARGAGDVTVASSGLRTVDGSAPDPLAVKAVARLGVGGLDGFRSRRFDPRHADADVVLTATVNQRDEVVRRAPHARERVFTWRELVALAGAAPLEPTGQESPVVRLGDVLTQVRARRGLVQPETEGGFDVPDPIGKPAKVFDRIADDVVASMASVADLVAAAAVGSAGR